MNFTIYLFIYICIDLWFLISFRVIIYCYCLFWFSAHLWFNQWEPNSWQLLYYFNMTHHSLNTSLHFCHINLFSVRMPSSSYFGSDILVWPTVATSTLSIIYTNTYIPHLALSYLMALKLSIWERKRRKEEEERNCFHFWRKFSWDIELFFLQLKLSFHCLLDFIVAIDESVLTHHCSLNVMFYFSWLLFTFSYCLWFSQFNYDVPMYSIS